MANSRIIRLSSENVKHVKAVSITLGEENHLVIIGGGNGEGKSSVLDSITYALAGKRALPPDPIRHGEKRAEIVVELDDIIVRRVFTRKGDRLEVTSRDGAKYPSPQKMLDALTGKLTFDPLSFARMCETAAGRREQAAILRDLAGLDFGELDARRAAIFDDRTLANRRLNDAKARLDAAPSHKNAPGAEVSVADLADELEAARVANQEYKTIGQRLIDQDVEIRQMQSEIERLQSELETAKEFRATDKAEFEALSQIDEEPIRERMRTAEAMNQQVRENATRIELHGEVGVWRDKAEVLTEQLVKIDTEKTATLAAAKMPIEGLGVDDSGVTYKGVPFEQASSAEALRVSVAMGLAGNPELRVMLVRDGSLLDDNSLRLLGELAKAADSQIWVERVSEGAECTVIIEDGRVAEEEEL